jgi:hypothetical protein
MTSTSTFAAAPKLEITVEGLVNAWMVADGEAPDYYPANPVLAAKLERELHDRLKAKYLGRIFNIDEIAVWVDEHTPAGRVMVRAMLDGSSVA